MLKKILQKYKDLSLPTKAAIWYTFCNFFNKGIALLTTPIFTRILTEEQYGTFAIFQSWINILIIFTSLNIFLGGYMKGLLKYKGDENSFTSSQLGLIILITFFFFTIYLLNIDLWTRIFDLSPAIMIGMFIELLAMPILELWLARQRFDYKYKKVILITILMNIFCIAVSIISILNTDFKLEARVFSDAIVKFLFTLPLLVLIFMKGNTFFNKEYWKYALVFNIPLIPHYLSNYVLTQSDRIMIGKMVGNEQAAYYSVAYTISTIIVLLITAINNSLTPYIYKSIDDKTYTKISTKIKPIIILVAISVVATMIFTPEIIYIFAGSNYLDAIYIIPPVAASVFFIFIYSLFVNVEYFYQKNVIIAISTTISACLNIVLNLFCIKRYGYYAAGYTTIICYLCLSMCHYIAYKNLVKKNLKDVKSIYDIKTILICSIFVLVMMIVLSFTYKLYLIRYIILLLIILIGIIIYKRDFKKGVK